ncbi:beta-galactosidase [Kouleothrix sp.]|uniref:beta-galactosidase n=1 Tax=Kouleothrix sp. TaxID=2779161 RepID=UPI00391BF439
MAYPPINPRAPYIWHGADYNPEQWPPATWDDDVALMRQAGCTIATVGVFSWVSLQPAEDRFTFEWLDSVIEKLHAAGRVVCLATPTAAQPAWMSLAYPDVLRADAYGRRVHHGGRTNFCPSSPSYRRFAAQIATRLAERYGRHPALVIWHISNEYGGSGLCYCENCAAAFREWLQRRYPSLAELNARWWTPFWSHTYTDWSQIEPPYADGESVTHGLTIDYRRFQSDAMLECFTIERDAIRAVAPGVPITTNMMGTFPHLDYRAWAKELDVVSWDCYPAHNATPSDIAFLHDLHRGLKDGLPFMLMEQTPSTQNWQPVNALKRPGVLRLWSYLAVAHGADTVMYFQWRRSRGGGEKFHGAVVDHGGRADTRVFGEVAALGAELARLADATLGAATPARVGLLFDWNNWWAVEGAIGPIRSKDYVAVVRKHYAALWRQRVPVDIVWSDSELAGYDLVVAPMLHMVKPGLAERVEAQVARGGTFVTTYFSGVVNENDLAFEGYPGPLARVLGIRVEEIDALPPGEENQIVMADGSGSYSCASLFDLLHSEGAAVLATYGRDFYAGAPALTANRFGQGQAIYIASDPEPRLLDDLYARLLAQHGIAPALDAPAGVEVALRQKGDRQLLFILNHNAAPATLALPGTFHDLLSDTAASGTIDVEGYGVRILAR